MPTVGRLQRGRLKVKNIIDERSPIITKGLHSHFPFDGTDEGYGNIWEGLLAYWKLDDLVDYSGNGNDLIYVPGAVNAVAPTTDGRLNGAYRSTSTAFHDHLISTNPIDLTGKSFTMSCWAYVTNVPGNSANGLFTNHSHSPAYGVGINVHKISDTDYRISCNTVLPDGNRTFNIYYGTSNIKDKWAHLTFRFEQPTRLFTLWVNGVKELEIAYDLFIQPNKVALFAWSTSYLTSNAYRAEAVLDEARIYDRALTDGEIASLAAYNTTFLQENAVLAEPAEDKRGIAIDPPSTNEIKNPDDATKWSTGSNKDPAYGFIADKLSITDMGSTYERTVNSTDYRSTLFTIPWVQPTNMNIPWTFSIYARCTNGNPYDAYVSLNWECRDANGVRVDRSNGRYLSNHEWTRITLTDIPANFNAASFLTHMKVYLRGRDGTAPVTIQVARPKMENNWFATAYTPNASGATVTSHKLSPGPSFTLFYRFTPNVNWASVPNLPWTSKNMWNLYDKNTGKKVWLSDYVKSDPNGFHRPWMGFDEFVTNATPNWHWHITSYWFPDTEYWMALRKEGTKWTRTLISQGTTVYQEDATMTDPALVAFSPSSMVFQGNYGMRVRDFTVYNRYITDDELLRLANTPFQVESDGTFKVSRLTERPPALPLDVLHIPLTEDGTDRFLRTSPYRELAVSYTADGAWVGQAASNYARYSISPYAPYHSLARTGENEITLVMAGDNKPVVFNINSQMALQGKTFSVSGYLTKNGEPFQIGTGSYRWNSYNTVNDVLYLNQDESTGYFEMTVYHSASTTWFFHMLTNNTKLNDVVVFRQLQIEERVYPSPYMAEMRDTSHFEYNLYRDYGLDWSKDWTIAYWKKPLGTSTLNSMTGYNLDSLGCNNNSVGHGYIWWGKTSGSDYIQGSANFDPATYYKKWRFVTITKSGSNMMIKERQEDGTVFNRQSSLVTSVPDHYVTPYGYDLKLGGWDNVNGGCNSYYKDLIVAKRALSDVELDALYQVQQRAGKNNFFVQHRVEENRTL